MEQTHKDNISKAMKGKMPKFIPNNNGVVRTAKNKKKISDTLKKKGIKPPRPPREALCRGEKHHWWKGGITPINEAVRKSLEYKLWRTAVFERDNFTCIWCGKKDKTIQADHIKPFALFPELRFAIDNGRTLCHDCHKTTDTYGKNVWGNEVESDINL
jgi:hypothetical protein